MERRGYKRGEKEERKERSAENLREKRERKERGRREKKERKFCEYKTFINKREISDLGLGNKLED